MRFYIFVELRGKKADTKKRRIKSFFFLLESMFEFTIK